MCYLVSLSLVPSNSHKHRRAIWLAYPSWIPKIVHLYILLFYFLSKLIIHLVHSLLYCVSSVGCLVKFIVACLHGWSPEHLLVKCVGIQHMNGCSRAADPSCAMHSTMRTLWIEMLFRFVNVISLLLFVNFNAEGHLHCTQKCWKGFYQI